MVLHEAGRDEDALADFRAALALREAMGDPGATRVAWWMVAWVLRRLDRLDEALAIQLRLERECAEAGEPDPYVIEELELLHKALGRRPGDARPGGTQPGRLALRPRRADPLGPGDWPATRRPPGPTG